MEKTFCQIVGHGINAQTCLSTQGQAGCVGCASPHRRCEVCKKEAVGLPASGMCEQCLATELAKEANVPEVSLSESTCQECKVREVRFARFRLCLTCIVSIFGGANKTEPASVVEKATRGRMRLKPAQSREEARQFSTEVKIRRLEGLAKSIGEGKILAQILITITEDLKELERLKKGQEG